MVIDLKNTQATVTTPKVKTIDIISVKFGNIEPEIKKLLLVSYFLVFFEIKLGIKNNACINPQTKNVQLAPCQNPLTRKIIKVFCRVINFPNFEPPKGMYK